MPPDLRTVHIAPPHASGCLPTSGHPHCVVHEEGGRRMSGVQGDKGYFATFVSLVASNDPQSSRAQTAASGPSGASGLRAPGSQRSAELPRSSPSGASGLRAPGSQRSAELPRSSSGWATCPLVTRGLRTTAPTPPGIRRSSGLRRLWGLRWRWHKWGAPEESPAEWALVPFRFRV